MLDEAHRSRFLLSGPLTCGVYGGGYTVIGKDRYVDAVLFGDLAAILAACSGAGKQKLPGPFRDPGSRLSLVAGTGFEPVTFRL